MKLRLAASFWTGKVLLERGPRWGMPVPIEDIDKWPRSAEVLLGKKWVRLGKIREDKALLKQLKEEDEKWQKEEATRDEAAAAEAAAQKSATAKLQKQVDDLIKRLDEAEERAAKAEAAVAAAAKPVDKKPEPSKPADQASLNL